jgi:hypothetical protein
MYNIAERYLQHKNDPRTVIPNGKPAYFGGEVTHNALVPAGQAELGTINFENWWSNQSPKA